METYKRFNRNGGTTEHRIGGMTLARSFDKDGKVIGHTPKSRVRYGKTQQDRARSRSVA